MNPQRTEFNSNIGDITPYSGCFVIDTTLCNTLTLRIGGVLLDNGILFITQALYEYTVAPTSGIIHSFCNIMTVSYSIRI